MNIEVFKFGGASIKDPERIRNVSQIIKSKSDSKLLVVMSALGKSTNALERILDAYCKKKPKEANSLLDELKSRHFTICKQIITEHHLEEALQALNDTFVEIEWILEEEPEDDYDYVYDQLVSIGELLSTKLVYHFLLSQGFNVVWLDARNVIKTNNTYREAKLDWSLTKNKINAEVPRLFESSDIILTQGFIACSSENFNTTLGREGSDYTAAIFSYCLDVEKLVIWKDVEGILTGDPSKLSDVEVINKLSYREAIEMTYYGAKVIHPKTIKPLQNKAIPLHVKSFLDPDNEGTTISSFHSIVYPAITVIELDQILIHITTKDFSFVAEDHLSEIFSILKKFRVKLRLMRNSAVSFTISILNPGRKLGHLFEELESKYDLVFTGGLSLYTIRHYNEEIIKRRLGDREIVFTEQYKDTIQLIVK